jgi:hypothetical protein
VVTVLAGCVTVAGGCVTVVVGCFTLTLIEFVVDDCVAAVDALWAVLPVLPPFSSLTASATPTPAAARATSAMAKSHPLERERSRVPHCGHDRASRATGAPQFVQKFEDGGSGAGGCADIGRSR